MAGVRRSGRIPKKIPIILLGTDTSGRVFSEKTRTLVLSRHGVGILSRNKFAPDEALRMRIAYSGRETEIRLVGHLGEDPRGNLYGVAFTASIRTDATHEELVECDNVSKGGFCFRSRKRDEEKSAIEVAVLFLPASTQSLFPHTSGALKNSLPAASSATARRTDKHNRLL